MDSIVAWFISVRFNKMYFIFNTEFNTTKRFFTRQTGKVSPAFGSFLYDIVIYFDIHSGESLLLEIVLILTMLYNSNTSESTQ